MDSGKQEVSWNSQLEKIISDEGERALCFSWLHSKSEKWFSRLSTYITLPVIVLSTLAGAGSIGSSTMFDGSPVAGILIGTISLSVATLNTVSSYFGWAKRSESHRIAGASYAKIYRFILIELALPRSERIAAKDMLKIVRDQSDRLHETSPQIPDNIIELFKVTFKDATEVKKPEITNGLDPIYVHPPDIESPSYRTARKQELERHLLETPPPPQHQPPPPIKISSDGHTQDTLRKLSSVQPQSESASDNSHT